MNHNVMFRMCLSLSLLLTICFVGVSSGQTRRFHGRKDVLPFTRNLSALNKVELLKLEFDDAWWRHAAFLEQEGRPMIISGKEEYLLDESEGRIKVGIAPHAQIFFIARSDQNFEKWLTMLKEAKERKQRVKCTVRTFSGRIENVAVQE